MISVTCNGDTFTLDDQVYYCCGYDAEIMPGFQPENGDECLNCERPCSPTFHGEVCSEQQVITRIHIPGRGFMRLATENYVKEKTK